MKSKNELFNYWLDSQYVDDKLKSQMLTMSDEEIAVAFKDDKLMFGTAGYRAIYGPGPMYLNKHTYQQLTVAYAKFLMNKYKNKKIRVFVGHDNRLDGREISQLIANILSSFDIEVYQLINNESVITPMVSFIIRHMGLDGGINVTASHNPKEYNGFKAYNSTGAQVNESQAAIISSNLPNPIYNLSRNYIPKVKYLKYVNQDVINAYYKSIDNEIFLNTYRNYRDPIVITTHHGAGSLYVTKYLESIGHNIVPVKEQCYEDSEFTNSPNMNPEDPISFKASIDLAEKIKSNLCIGFDPDGDRMAIAVKHDKQWFFLNGNEMGILASFYLIKYKRYNQKTPMIISTFVSNDLIDRIASFYDGFVIRTATGFKNIAQAMDEIKVRTNEYIISFEEAVGMNYSLATREKDGVAAAALVLEMYNFYKEKNQTLIDVLWYQIYQKYGKWFGRTISIKIPGANWKSLAKQLEQNVLNVPVKTKLLNNFVITNVIYNKDGNCIEWHLKDGSWIKFRISGTEPKFKIYYNLYFNDDGFNYNYFKYECIVEQLTKIIEEIIFI